MLLEVQKVSKSYRDIGTLLISQIRNEYARTPKGRGSHRMWRRILIHAEFRLRISSSFGKSKSCAYSSMLDIQLIEITNDRLRLRLFSPILIPQWTRLASSPIQPTVIFGKFKINSRAKRPFCKGKYIAGQGVICLRNNPAILFSTRVNKTCFEKKTIIIMLFIRFFRFLLTFFISFCLAILIYIIQNAAKNLLVKLGIKNFSIYKKICRAEMPRGCCREFRQRLSVLDAKLNGLPWFWPAWS